MSLIHLDKVVLGGWVLDFFSILYWLFYLFKFQMLSPSSFPSTHHLSPPPSLLPLWRLFLPTPTHSCFRVSPRSQKIPLRVNLVYDLREKTERSVANSIVPKNIFYRSLQKAYHQPQTTSLASVSTGCQSWALTYKLLHGVWRFKFRSSSFHV